MQGPACVSASPLPASVAIKQLGVLSDFLHQRPSRCLPSAAGDVGPDFSQLILMGIASTYPGQNWMHRERLRL